MNILLSVLFHALLALPFFALSGGNGTSKGSSDQKEENIISIVETNGSSDSDKDGLELQKQKDEKKECSNYYGGIGIKTKYSEVGHIVDEIYEGYPAHKAGLRKGDQIVEGYWNLRGEIGQQAVALIKREAEVFTMTFIREKICIE